MFVLDFLDSMNLPVQKTVLFCGNNGQVMVEIEMPHENNV